MCGWSTSSIGWNFLYRSLIISILNSAIFSPKFFCLTIKMLETRQGVPKPPQARAPRPTLVTSSYERIYSGQFVNFMLNLWLVYIFLNKFCRCRAPHFYKGSTTGTYTLSLRKGYDVLQVQFLELLLDLFKRWHSSFYMLFCLVGIIRIANTLDPCTPKF